MAEPSPTPTFSISIEWENARFAKLERTRRMLRRLRQELIDLAPPPSPPEVVFLYDRLSVEAELVTRTVEEAFRPGSTPAVTRILPTEGLRYYEQKNVGVDASHGDIAIFLDCDVVPEAGWLKAILAPFTDPAVSVVGGETYVELEGFVSRAFSLFWLFNLREEADDLAPATFFHANNVAFRRGVFDRNRFPDAPIYRGQCTLLSHALCADGVGLYRSKAARASHPCPITFGYFSARALNGGHDFLVVERLLGRGASVKPRREYRQRLGYAARRIRQHGGEVGLGPLGAGAALAVAFGYFTLFTVGEMISLSRPGLIPRWLPI